jgi:hypothetical protein
MRKRTLLLVLIAVLLPISLVASKGSGSHRSSSGRSASHSSSIRSSSSHSPAIHSSKTASSSSKPVHVSSYHRKDGTVVQAHNRAAPGTKPATSKSVTVRSARTSTGAATVKKSTAIKARAKSTTAARDSNGRIARSETAKRAFMKSSGYPNGRKGYAVDHVVPLECGGADAPSNMQWQTVEQAKIKDRSERNCRR